MSSGGLSVWIRFAGFLAAMFAGCGDRSGEVMDESGIMRDGHRVVEIRAGDEMKFDLSEIRAAPGEPLEIVLIHTGRMSREMMGHNWVLFERMPAADLNRLAMDAARRPPEYLPENRDAVLAHTRMIGGRERDRLRLHAPDEPGEYVYACTFPGHFVLMRGVLVVEE